MFDISRSKAASGYVAGQDVDVDTKCSTSCLDNQVVSDFIRYIVMNRNISPIQRSQIHSDEQKHLSNSAFSDT
ncbi:hypothetical protein BgiBS90_012413 [Biomphalaria glabrata]|nr:hypothetical protein BgiBS90_012413 [Biomphalaria glabrata]